MRLILAALAFNLSQGQDPFWLGQSPKESPCPCLFAGTTLPADAAAAAGNPLYGTSCEAAWDGLPGTTYYKNQSFGFPLDENGHRVTCPMGAECDKGCTFLYLPWCYIDRACATANNLPAFNTTLAVAAPGSLSYSYAACGNPYCWADFGGWDAQCPYVPTKTESSGVLNQCADDTCSCVYEGTTLPESAAAAAGNPLYGTSCAHAWDSFPGTAYYKNSTHTYSSDYMKCPMGTECEKGCNYLQLEWCYVQPGCKGAASFNTTLSGAGVALAYSYEMCGNPYCWDDFGSWDPTCPGGDMCWDVMSCQDGKNAYRASGCCGMPTKSMKLTAGMTMK
jgi:hypothetical protein